MAEVTLSPNVNKTAAVEKDGGKPRGLGFFKIFIAQSAVAAAACGALFLGGALSVAPVKDFNGYFKRAISYNPLGLSKPEEIGKIKFVSLIEEYLKERGADGGVSV